MVAIDFDWPIHLLGESRYEANGTLVAAHGCVAYMDVGEADKCSCIICIQHIPVF